MDVGSRRLKVRPLSAIWPHLWDCCNWSVSDGQFGREGRQARQCGAIPSIKCSAPRPPRTARTESLRSNVASLALRDAASANR